MKEGYRKTHHKQITKTPIVTAIFFLFAVVFHRIFQPTSEYLFSNARAVLISSISYRTNSSSSWPLAWYSAKTAWASSKRPLARRKRGDSGMKGSMMMRKSGATAWIREGMRHDQEVERCPEPNDPHAAMMAPTYLF